MQKFSAQTKCQKNNIKFKGGQLWPYLPNKFHNFCVVNYENPCNTCICTTIDQPMQNFTFYYSNFMFNCQQIYLVLVPSPPQMFSSNYTSLATEVSCIKHFFLTFISQLLHNTNLLQQKSEYILALLALFHFCCEGKKVLQEEIPTRSARALF